MKNLILVLFLVIFAIPSQAIDPGSVPFIYVEYAGVLQKLKPISEVPYRTTYEAPRVQGLERIINFRQYTPDTLMSWYGITVCVASPDTFFVIKVVPAIEYWKLLYQEGTPISSVTMDDKLKTCSIWVYHQNSPTGKVELVINVSQKMIAYTPEIFGTFRIEEPSEIIDLTNNEEESTWHYSKIEPKATSPSPMPRESILHFLLGRNGNCPFIFTGTRSKQKE